MMDFNCDCYPYCVRVKLDALLFNSSVLEVLEQHKSTSFTKASGSQMGFIVYICRLDVLNCRFIDNLLNLPVEIEPIIGHLG